jgi:hypothetical protein
VLPFTEIACQASSAKRGCPFCVLWAYGLTICLIRCREKAGGPLGVRNRLNHAVRPCRLGRQMRYPCGPGVAQAWPLPQEFVSLSRRIEDPTAVLVRVQKIAWERHRLIAKTLDHIEAEVFP